MPSCTVHPTIKNAANKGTAQLCHDYAVPGQQIHSEPDPKRALTRLMTVLAVAAMTVWAIVYIAEHNESGSMQVKKVKGQPLQVAKKNFPALPAGSILKATAQPSPNVTCPCATLPNTYHWCNFINFSLIVCNKETNYLPKETMISTTNGACNRPPNLGSLFCQDFAQNLQDACINALNTAFDFIQSSQMPYIQTPTLSTSLDVHDRIADKMLANIDTTNQTTQYNTSTKNNGIVKGAYFSPATSYNDTKLALLLLQSMVLQVFDCKTSSTPQEFWDRGMTCAWNMYPEIGERMNGSKFVFGMSVDYDAYANQCKPSYCYIFTEEGLTTRFMHAFAEVGGVWSIIALGIRFILWPLVAIIFRFPHAPSLNLTKLGSITNELHGDS